MRYSIALLMGYVIENHTSCHVAFLSKVVT